MSQQILNHDTLGVEREPNAYQVMVTMIFIYDICNIETMDYMCKYFTFDKNHGRQGNQRVLCPSVITYIHFDNSMLELIYCPPSLTDESEQRLSRPLKPRTCANTLRSLLNVSKKNIFISNSKGYFYLLKAEM